MNFLPGMKPGFLAPTAGLTPPQITFVNDSFENDYSSGPFALPTGLQEDDVVVIAMWMDTNGSGPPAASGWTSIWGGGQAGTLYKRMGSTPDTSATFTGHTNSWGVVAQTFRGVDPTTALDVAYEKTNGSSGYPNPPSITTVSDGCMVVAVGMLDDELDAGSVAAPAGYSNLTDAESTYSDGATTMMASKLLDTAGTQNPGAFSGPGNDESKEVTLALRPA